MAARLGCDVPNPRKWQSAPHYCPYLWSQTVPKGVHWPPNVTASFSACPTATQGKNNMPRLSVYIVGLLLGATTSAQADGYGAIAVDRSTGRSGWSSGYSSQQEAISRALQACSKVSRNCEFILRFWGDTCAAIVSDWDGKNSWWGIGSSPQAAVWNAHQACFLSQNADLCTAVVSACNPPSPPAANAPSPDCGYSVFGAPPEFEGAFCRDSSGMLTLP
jgi:hypothetical protein